MGANADFSSAVGTAGLKKPRTTERTFPKNSTYFTFNIKHLKLNNFITFEYIKRKSGNRHFGEFIT